MNAEYIFGIIETSEEKIFNSCGIEDYKEVYAIPYQGISAVVSNLPFIDYTLLPKDKVARYLLAHQMTIEKIMDSYAIIPMRLGTYASNISEVKEILYKGYAKFKDIFRKIENKIEIDIAAAWNDLDSVIKEISEEQGLKELKERLMSSPEGASIDDRIRIGSLAKNVLNKKREKISSEIGETLRKMSIDSKAHELMDDRMISNSAFLIHKEKKIEFEKKLDELNELYEGKIDFRCIGPLPPYSFYTAEVKKISFSDIEWAKKRLCINNTATKGDIVKAYRSKAHLYHPDKNIGSPDAERQFNEIFRAYKIILECCNGNNGLFSDNESNPLLPPLRVMTFSKEGKEEFSGKNKFSGNAIIVKIKE